jgi:hypothetical protein
MAGLEGKGAKVPAPFPTWPILTMQREARVSVWTATKDSAKHLRSSWRDLLDEHHGQAPVRRLCQL